MCGRCKKQVDGLVEPVEELCEEVEAVRGFCCLEDRVNASVGCEAAVIARARIGWVKFKELGTQKGSHLRQKEWFMRVVYDRRCYMGVRHGV